VVYKLNDLRPAEVIQSLQAGIEISLRYIQKQWIENKVQWLFIIILLIWCIRLEIKLRKK